MNEALTFVLNIRETVSSGLAQLANHSKSVFSGIDKNIANTQKQFSMAGRSVNDLNNRLELLTQKRDLSIGTGDIIRANREIQALENRIERIQTLGRSNAGVSGGSGSGGGMLLGGLGFAAGYMAVSGTMDIARQALEAGMNAEQQIIALKTFVGEARAKQVYADIQKSSALTPFTTADIFPAIQGLVATGQTVEKAKKDTWALMNAMSGTGNSGNSFMFGLMASHMAQAASNGKMDGYTFREFQRTAHIPVTRLIANDLYPKLTIEAGMKKVNALDHIPYNVFTHALQRAHDARGMFAGALEAQSQTIAGKWSTIRDWWNIGLAKVALDPKMHDKIVEIEDKMIKWLALLPDRILELTPAILKLGDNIMHLISWVAKNSNELINLGKIIIAAKIAGTIGGGMKGLIEGYTNKTLGVLLASRTGIMALAGGSGSGLAGVAAGTEGVSMSGLAGAAVGAMGGSAVLIALAAAAAWGIWKGIEGTKMNLSKYTISGFTGNENEQHASKIKRAGNDIQQRAERLKKDAESMRPIFDAIATKSKLLNVVGIERKGVGEPIYKMFTAASWAVHNAVAKKVTDTAKDNAVVDDGVETGTITGGGGKKIYFNFRNIVEHFNVDVKDAAQTLGVSEEKLGEIWMQFLYSAKAAMS